jgi:hypothetical protein
LFVKSKAKQHAVDAIHDMARRVIYSFDSYCLLLFLSIDRRARSYVRTQARLLITLPPLWFAHTHGAQGIFPCPMYASGRQRLHNRHTGKWATEVLSVLWSLRTTPNRSTSFTPFFMVYVSEASWSTVLEDPEHTTRLRHIEMLLTYLKKHEKLHSCDRPGISKRCIATMRAGSIPGLYKSTT